MDCVSGKQRCGVTGKEFVVGDPRINRTKPNLEQPLL